MFRIFVRAFPGATCQPEEECTQFNYYVEEKKSPAYLTLLSTLLLQQHLSYPLSMKPFLRKYREFDDGALLDFVASPPYKTCDKMTAFARSVHSEPLCLKNVMLSSSTTVSALTDLSVARSDEPMFAYVNRLIRMVTDPVAIRRSVYTRAVFLLCYQSWLTTEQLVDKLVDMFYEPLHLSGGLATRSAATLVAAEKRVADIPSGFYASMSEVAVKLEVISLIVDLLLYYRDDVDDSIVRRLAWFLLSITHAELTAGAGAALNLLNRERSVFVYRLNSRMFSTAVIDPCRACASPRSMPHMLLNPSEKDQPTRASCSLSAPLSTPVSGRQIYAEHNTYRHALPAVSLFLGTKALPIDQKMFALGNTSMFIEDEALLQFGLLDAIQVDAFPYIARMPNILIKYPSSLKDQSAKIIGASFMHFISECYYHIHPREFLGSTQGSLATKHKAPYLSLLTTRVNILNQFVTCAVMSIQTPAARARMIAKLIRAASYMLDSHHIEGAFAVVTGLTSPVLQRLDNFMDGVNKADTETLQDIRDLNDFETNYKRYKRFFVEIDAISLDRGMPCIPTVSVVLKDIFLIEENKTFTEGKAYFERGSLVYNLIAGYLKYQLMQPWPTPLYQQFHNELSNIHVKEDDEMWALSHEIKPVAS